MEEIYRNYVSDDWLFFVFTAGLGLVVLTRSVYPSYVLKGIEAMVSAGSRADKGERLFVGYNILNTLVYSLLLALFISLMAANTGILPLSPLDSLFVWGAVVGYLGVIAALTYLCGWIMGAMPALRQIYRSKIITRDVSSCVMLPVLFILYYSGAWTSLFTSGLIYLCVVIFMISELLFAAKYFARSLRVFFYFILYLCTVELLPVLVIAKVLLNS